MSTPITTPTTSLAGEQARSAVPVEKEKPAAAAVEKPLSPPEPSPAAAELPSTNGKHELEESTGESEAKRAKVEDDSVPSQVEAPTSQSSAAEESAPVQQQQASSFPVPTEPAPKPPTEPDMDNLPSDPIPKHQQQYGIRVVKIIKRMKDAAPFLQPVDTVKLNVPFYYNYIKRPMDLSTIEKKLTVNAYADTKDFVDDFNLMVENCVRFNGADSVIAQMARNIQASFEKHILNMPAKELPPNTKTTTGGRKRNSAAPGELNAEGVPTIRRESNVNGRPKREIHPPKPKDMPYDTRPRKKKFVPELRFSQQVLKELSSKKYESFNFPFLEPVDPVALNCPTYFDYIKEPMDFSTIQNKLNNNQYENADEFEHDIRLVFKNCYTFNPEGTAVNMMGHRLEEIFDKKWVDRPIAPPTPSQSDIELESEEESEEEEEINESMVTSPAIQFLEEQLERMKQQLAKLKKEEMDKLRKERAKKKKSKKPKTKKRKISYDTNTVLTYDMKKDLSEKIGELPEKKLNQALAIISESLNLTNQNGEEIELDMDQLDNATLLKLYSFVVKKSKSSSSSSSRRAPSSSSISKKSKKNKNLTEAEQAQQIEELKKKIDLLNQSSSVGMTSMETTTFTGNDSDDSDDDISSESSEEE